MFYNIFLLLTCLQQSAASTVLSYLGASVLLDQEDSKKHPDKTTQDYKHFACVYVFMCNKRDSLCHSMAPDKDDLASRSKAWSLLLRASANTGGCPYPNALCAVPVSHSALPAVPYRIL